MLEEGEVVVGDALHEVWDEDEGTCWVVDVPGYS